MNPVGHEAHSWGADVRLDCLTQPLTPSPIPDVGGPAVRARTRHASIHMLRSRQGEWRHAHADGIRTATEPRLGSSPSVGEEMMGPGVNVLRLHIHAAIGGHVEEQREAVPVL